MSMKPIICDCGHSIEVHNLFNCTFAFEKENECRCPLGKSTVEARWWARCGYQRAMKAEAERDEAKRSLETFLAWRNANDPYA
ncbi:MAG: hypothetical protein A2136_05525 [Chloroflexi bacterium RBG_16_54_11]|nr:MAG: hypothetical protein A2136_05525 [Chloroflexi bacterium RBG_16_54_11]